MPKGIYKRIVGVNYFSPCGMLGKQHTVATKEKMRQAVKTRIGIGLTDNLYGKGSRHPNWKGGKTQTYEGRWLVWKPNHPFATKQRYVRQSRLVVEGCIGRYLFIEEVIHHINGNPSDDRPENLYLFASKSKHTAYEKLGNKPALRSNLTKDFEDIK